MARRKRSKQPNLPEATLQRAREQAGLTDEIDGADDDDVAEVAPPPAAAPARPAENAAVARPARSSRQVSAARLERSKKRGEVDAELMEYMLEHPNKTVTEDELRAQYGHVLVDLRNMGLLAAVLIGLMVIIAQFI
ncbi:MAG: hypothetical protein MUE40_05040 [Anaerolineae bacterium]|nr:hypothetical protein [Anaerolineae bacterium]